MKVGCHSISYGSKINGSTLVAENPRSHRNAGRERADVSTRAKIESADEASPRENFLDLMS